MGLQNSPFMMGVSSSLRLTNNFLESYFIVISFPLKLELTGILILISWIKCWLHIYLSSLFPFPGPGKTVPSLGFLLSSLSFTDSDFSSSLGISFGTSVVVFLFFSLSASSGVISLILGCWVLVVFNFSSSSFCFFFLSFSLTSSYLLRNFLYDESIKFLDESY